MAPNVGGDCDARATPSIRVVQQILTNAEFMRLFCSCDYAPNLGSCVWQSGALQTRGASGIVSNRSGYDPRRTQGESMTARARLKIPIWLATIVAFGLMSIF